jgi:hypothetical protein
MHDTKIATQMLKRIKRAFALFVADKGYDAESIRRALRQKGRQVL